MLAGAVGMASVANRRQELQEEGPVALLEHALFSADAKDDFLLAAERCRVGSHAGTRKLQSAPTKSELRRGEHRNFAVGQDGVDSGDGLGEPFEGGGFIRRMYEAGGDIAAVGAVDFLQCVVALVQFKQVPFCGGAVQIGHALADERGTTLRNK